MPWSRDFFSYLIDNYHGRTYINLLISFIGVVIPKILSIHPIVWMHGGAAIIKGFFIAVIYYQLSDLLFITDFAGQKYPHPKNDSFWYKTAKNLLKAIFAVIFYCNYLKLFGSTYMFELYASFYGFTFPFIIYLFFLKKFIISYLDNFKEISVIKMCILVFLVGTSSEFFSFTTIAALYLFVIFEKFINKKPVKQFFPILAAISAGFIIYITNRGFIGSWTEKITNINIDSKTQYLRKAFHEIYNVFLNDFILIVILSGLFFFLILITNKENRTKILIFFYQYIPVYFVFISACCLQGCVKIAFFYHILT